MPTDESLVRELRTNLGYRPRPGMTQMPPEPGPPAPFAWGAAPDHPPMWSEGKPKNQISDPRWEKWYADTAEDVMGSPAGRFARTFNSAFREPIFEGIDGPASAEQLLTLLADDYAKPNQLDSAQLQQAVRAKLSGRPWKTGNTQADEHTNVVTQQLLSEMGSQSAPSFAAPWGSQTQVPAVSEREYEKMLAKDPLDARYTIPREGRPAYQRQRIFDLARTFQEGEFAPPWAGPGAAALGYIGSPFNSDTAQLAFNRIGAMGSNSEMFDYLGGTTGTPQPYMIEEALYWYDRGKDQDKTRTSLGGGNFPGESYTNVEGVANNLMNHANAVPWHSAGLRAAIYNPVERSPADWEYLGNTAAQVQRSPAMVLPEGVSREAGEKARSTLLNRQSEEASWFSSQWPRIVNATNRLLGTQFEPTYLSPAASSLANLPANYVSDWPTLLTVGAAGLGGLATGMGRGGLGGVIRGGGQFAGHVLRDLMGEAPGELSIDGLMNAGSGESWFSPEKTNFYMKDTPANAPPERYEADYEARNQGRQKEFRELQGLMPPKQDPTRRPGSNRAIPLRNRSSG